MPQTKTWVELGFKNVPESRVEIEKGTDRFERLSDDEKKRILGPAKFAAYKDGKLKLEDVAGFARHKNWGPVGYERSLRDILGEKEAKKWMAEAVKTQRMQGEPNKLIREWINPKRVPSEAEIRNVLEYVAKAPFRSAVTGVDKVAQGQMFLGRRLNAKEPSIVAHLAKRVLVESQWTESTTLDQYLADIHSVAGDPDVKMAVYVRRGKALYLGLLGRNRVPSERLGARPENYLWVVYSPDYGTIVSGYQVSGVANIGLPEVVRWL
ncbi:MAG: hypothetical protein HYY30_08010 [Chloroflexi bacterium]|nr:hypothetical protein [Chloroflexota bacterium]